MLAGAVTLPQILAGELFLQEKHAGRDDGAGKKASPGAVNARNKRGKRTEKNETAHDFSGKRPSHKRQGEDGKGKEKFEKKADPA